MPAAHRYLVCFIRQQCCCYGYLFNNIHAPIYWEWWSDLSPQDMLCTSNITLMRFWQNLLSDTHTHTQTRMTFPENLIITKVTALSDQCRFWTVLNRSLLSQNLSLKVQKGRQLAHLEQKTPLFIVNIVFT